MERSYDIINELGPRNWLDAAAGEAVILGYLAKDMELEMLGTALAEELAKVRFDSDGFSKVEAQATDLKKMIEKKKSEMEAIISIDQICEYDGGRKSLYKWEYGLVLMGRQYVITMLMPEYQGSLPDTENREQVEEIVQNSYTNPSFAELTRLDERKKVGHQKKDTAKYYTDDRRLVCQYIDFQHEDGPKRGRYVKYFMDSYAQAIATWNAVRTISGQKR
jgi:hypothetical protein